MSLTLVTGPANSEKAREVLDAFRAVADEGAVLVVPTAADAERYRAELVEGGLVLGSRVVGWSWLEEELVRRAGAAAPPLSSLQCARVAA
ncbi:MAG: hypothetical protein M3P39_04635, partial [Actinomycetota bacterium]|nr:hypothetical protein [Actinomycetota bacterium]